LQIFNYFSLSIGARKENKKNIKNKEKRERPREKKRRKIQKLKKYWRISNRVRQGDHRTAMQISNPVVPEGKKGEISLRL
jgi:hypothetical protein